VVLAGAAERPNDVELDALLDDSDQPRVVAADPDR
jgi:hypothetical protein